MEKLPSPMRTSLLLRHLRSSYLVGRISAHGRPLRIIRGKGSCLNQLSVTRIVVRNLSSRQFGGDDATAADDDDDDDDDDDERGGFDESLNEEEWLNLIHSNEQTEKKWREQEVRDEMNLKKGRGWSDLWGLEEMMNAKLTLETLPNWSPNHVSRVTQERVQVHEKKIPTLQEVAGLALPAPPPPHPGLGLAKAYALQRKRLHYRIVAEKVQALAEPRVAAIQALPTWEEKQEAVDRLFEEIELDLKAKEEILGKHPNFGLWVERALEDYLRAVRKEKLSDSNSGAETALEQQDPPEAKHDQPPSKEKLAYPSKQEDENSVPVFIDCFRPDDSKKDVVPKIIHPLRPSTSRSTVGSMVEEWEMSAHKESKRIMMRQCTRQIARALVENDQVRVYVCGQQGVGKTAALASIVACARQSGYVVLYMPDGDELRKNGFYVEPNAKRPGIFDLPVLSQQVCRFFLESHEGDLSDFTVEKSDAEEFFTEDQMERLPFEEDRISVAKLLKYATEHTSSAGSCFSMCVNTLMKQDQKPFLIVLDEYNCFFDKGQYFHTAYDEDVEKPIPYKQISLFQYALEGMALTGSDDEDESAGSPYSVPFMRRGGIVVGTTESHAVGRKVTDSLSACAKEHAAASGKGDLHPVHLRYCEVSRLSALEVKHMVANYEATGFGRLRIDRGDTLMNDQELAFLRMISGGVAQKLMDACIQ